MRFEDITRKETMLETSICRFSFFCLEKGEFHQLDNLREDLTIFSCFACFSEEICIKKMPVLLRALFRIFLMASSFRERNFSKFNYTLSYFDYKIYVVKRTESWRVCFMSFRNFSFLILQGITRKKR